MLEIIITSSALILVISTLRLIFGNNISRRMRYTMWGIVLLRLLIPFQLFQSPVSILNIVPHESQTQIRQSLSDDAISGDEISLSNSNNSDAAGAMQPEPNISPAESVLSGSFFANLNPLIMIWLTGAIIAALWLTTVNLVFYRKLRKQRRLIEIENCRLPVYIVDDLQSPCLFGVFRPAIYMTTKAIESEHASAHVLAHELIHFAHKDNTWSLLRGICVVVYWFNPFVWLAAILSRADCELACDEAAIMGVGEENRIAYARTLVDIIASKRTSDTVLCAATTMASGTSRIKKRLNMIVQNKKTVIPAVVIVVIVVVIAAVATFTGTRTKDIPDEVGNSQSDISTDTQMLSSLPPIISASADDDGAAVEQVNESDQTYSSENPHPNSVQTPGKPSTIPSQGEQTMQITYDDHEVVDVTERVGESFPLQVRVEPSDLDVDEEITWTSSDPSVFEVVKHNPRGTTATIKITGSGSRNYAVLTVTRGGIRSECIIRVDSSSEP